MNTLTVGLDEISTYLNRVLGKFSKQGMLDLVWTAEGNNITDEARIVAHDIVIRHFGDDIIGQYRFTYGAIADIKTEIARLGQREAVVVNG